MFMRVCVIYNMNPRMIDAGIALYRLGNGHNDN